MIRTSSTNLKAKLGQFLRSVRSGREVIITDREVPVAKLVPFTEPPVQAGALAVRSRDPTAPPFNQVRVRSIQYRGTSTTDLLRQDRDRR